MKKISLLLAVPFILFISCQKQQAQNGVGNVSTLTNVHAPISGSDSIKFTADTSIVHLLVFSPLTGTNHVVVHDMTTGIDLFNGDVSSTDQPIAGFLPGDSYAIICYSGAGSSTNFTRVSSSFKNSGTTPLPFVGYTQYYNTVAPGGPADGAVVLILEEPSMGGKIK